MSPASSAGPEREGGEEELDPGAVGWVSFRHYTARPTLHVEDGPTGVTYLADVPVPGDPHAHIHNALFIVEVTEDGRIGSLDTQRLHAFASTSLGAYFQARLATAAARLGGIRTGYTTGRRGAQVRAAGHPAARHRRLLQAGRRKR